MDDHHSSTAPLYRRTSRWDKLFLPLLLALGALLLAIWGLPESAQLKQSSSLFPTWLHSITELFAMVVALLLFSVTLPPAQKVVEPPAVVTASGGTGR